MGRSKFLIAAFTSGALLLLVDQWSKRTVQRSPDSCVLWGAVLQVKYVANLKSIYQRGGARTLLVLVFFTALASAILLHRSGGWFQSRTSLLGLGFAFGGAAGNLFDILRWHSVVDFVDLGWWPVFNFADVGIVAGLILAFWPHL